jgi:hypothetical protein
MAMGGGVSTIKNPLISINKYVYIPTQRGKYGSEQGIALLVFVK